MANKYLSPAGTDTGSCPINAPCLTVGYINTNATAGDDCYLADGNYVAPASPGYFNLTKHIDWIASNTEGAIWKADSGHSGYVWRIGASAPTGSMSMTGLVFDAESRVAQASEIGADTDVFNYTSTDCKHKDFTNRGLNVFHVLGTHVLTRPYFTSSAATAASCGGVVNGNLNAGSGASAFSMTITYPRFDLTAAAAQTIYGVYLARDAAPASAVTVSVTAPYGSVTSHVSAAAYGVFLLGVDSAQIIGDGGKTLTINSVYASAASHAIFAVGRGASATANDSILKGNGQRIEWNAASGHAVSLGESVGSNYMTGGEITGWIVRGQYHATNTPHGVSLGEGTSGRTAGNTVSDCYANHLMSKTAAGTVRQNDRSFDTYGVSFYSKGVTAGKWVGCSAYHTGKWTQRNLASIHVDSQAGVDTAAVTYDGCMVVWGTDDLAKVTKLVGARVNQSFTMTNCTFVVPDTVATSTALFEIGSTSEGSLGGGTTYTAAQWESGTAGSVTAANGTGTISVGGCKVLFLPARICAQIINGAQPQMGVPALEIAGGVVVPL